MSELHLCLAQRFIKIMKIIKQIFPWFLNRKSEAVPLLIIKKETEIVKEYKSIEEAITDLANDPNVPSEKIEKLKSSFRDLKNKTSIKIKDGEIIK